MGLLEFFFLSCLPSNSCESFAIFSFPQKTFVDDSDRDDKAERTPAPLSRESRQAQASQLRLMLDLSYKLLRLHAAAAAAALVTSVSFGQVLGDDGTTDAI